MSRIGKKPVPVPEGVSATLSGQTVQVSGPLGTSTYTATDDVSLTQEGGVICVSPRGASKRARQQWGMSRTMIANLVAGAAKPFRKELRIHGVGYRAQMEGGAIRLNLGLSHDVRFPVPDDVSITVPRPTEIVIEGRDRQRVGQVAADIRRWRPPEPYKGKGIRHAGEFIFQKASKKK